ncbi:MAG: DUF5103 domain-containing protein [Bacteroidetes bacterium]|nr:DUF5103 domain-containing protein [Bacteroidota bacterium]MBT6687435.1 DUF5103 domain-containing protein [Bacteroidota bacterium]MBT7142303.1 DUF5103 domain-containing protein [Bacteroidota bacterium]MBT7493352.1 DUF5103 domain-containing protein [Bacteroidota bacterium]
MIEIVNFSKFKASVSTFLFCTVFLFYTGQQEGYAQELTDSDSVPEFYNDNFLRYSDFVYKNSIKTVKIHREGWDLSHPIIELNGEDKILLSFDDLRAEIADFSYKLVHCNSRWEPSDLMSSEFIEGFEENQIEDYELSFNTFQKYTHHWLTIPNENIKATISGNYIIKVYEDFDEENLVLSRRFMITENNVNIEAEVKQSSIIDLRKSHQEIDFKIRPGISLSDPYSEIQVVLMQNGRWDNKIDNLKPLFIKDNLLIYDYDEDNSFAAGSEFRYFDIKSVRYQSDRIKSILFKKPFYHVDLLEDHKRTFKVYFYNKDINGKYFIDIQEAVNKEIEADYVYVNFTLPFDAPVVNGNLYLFGLLSDWSFSNTNKMKYDYEKKAYTLTMFLKQGYYNYEYVLLEDGETAGNVSYIEGSHYETDNDYLILVYLKGINERYDRLLGIKIINSMKRF